MIYKKVKDNEDYYEQLIKELIITIGKVVNEKQLVVDQILMNDQVQKILVGRN